MKRLHPRRLVRDLSGRAGSDMTRLLRHQVRMSIEGAQHARRASLGELTSADAREGMVEIEHTGDEARRQLVLTLGGSLVTPFDREDMFRVSRSIDDVLDNLRDFVRELDLFQANDDRLVPVIDAVIDGLELLERAIEVVTDGSGELEQRTLAAKKSGNEIRRAYDEQLADVLSGDVTTGMLHRRELLRRLDVVGLRLGEAVDALADAAVKRTL